MTCSPDESEKPFEAELPIFPEKKERLKEAPFLSWKKAIAQKSGKRSAGNSSKKNHLILFEVALLILSFGLYYMNITPLFSKFREVSSH